MASKYARRHYEDIADILHMLYRRGKPGHGVQLFTETMGDFVELFKGDNTRFDEGRFKTACLHGTGRGRT